MKRHEWVIATYLFIAVFLVVIAYLVMIILIRYRNKFDDRTPLDTRGREYEVKPGDIVMRRIFKFGILGNLYHVGLVSRDVTQIYHRTIFRFDKTPWNRFMSLEKRFYVFHAPEHAYLPLEETMRLAEEMVEREKSQDGIFSNFNIISQNCEHKVFHLRLKPSYIERFRFNSVQMHHLFCKNRSDVKCRNAPIDYYRTRHDFSEFKSKLKKMKR